MDTKHICDCCKDKEIIIKYIKCSTYTDSQMKAIMNYREKNTNKNRDNAKAYYNKMKEDPEWKAKFNERMKMNARKRKEIKLLKENEIINKIEI